MALVRPDRIRNQVTIQGKGERFGSDSNNLGWIPIGHDSPDGSFAHQERVRFRPCWIFPRLALVFQPVSHQSRSCWPL